jgi:hypothetical protein
LTKLLISLKENDKNNTMETISIAISSPYFIGNKSGNHKGVSSAGGGRAIRGSVTTPFCRKRQNASGATTIPHPAIPPLPSSAKYFPKMAIPKKTISH